MRSEGLFLLVFLLLALFFTSETTFLSLIKAKQADFWSDLGWNLLRWLPWAFFVPFIVRIVRRQPFENRKWQVWLIVHLLAGIVFSFLHSTFFYTYYAIQAPGQSGFNPVMLWIYFVKFIHLNILTYWIIIGICHLNQYYRKYRDRELRASRLEAQLMQSHLKTLEMQLHPHFLFNTLHAISALIHKNPKAADRLISRLSDMLRLSLENSRRLKILLKDEIAFIRLYVDIEKARLGDRLEVEFDIDVRVMTALIPNFMLQPLVENAIRHGIAPSSKGGRIIIRALRRNDRLNISIEDTGMGFATAGKDAIEMGGGLRNVNLRLKQLYGADCKFDLMNAEGGGAVVQMSIPYVESL